MEDQAKTVNLEHELLLAHRADQGRYADRAGAVRFPDQQRPRVGARRPRGKSRSRFLTKQLKD